MCVCANKQVLVTFQQASFHLRQRRLGCSTSVIGGDSTSTWKVIQAFHHPLSLDYFMHLESVRLLNVPNYYGAPNWLVFFVLIYIYIYIHTHTHTHRVSQEECARLREGVPYVKVYRYNPKHLCPKLNGYGDNSQRRVWSSGGSTHCTCQLTSLIDVCP